MILRPDRLRDFAQRSRDVVLASALVGVVTGLAVAGADRLTTDLLDWVRDWPAWLVLVGPGIGLVGAALTLRYLAFRLSPGLGYHEASAQDARRRIIAFFDAHLKGGRGWRTAFTSPAYPELVELP